MSGPPQPPQGRNPGTNRQPDGGRKGERRSFSEADNAAPGGSWNDTLSVLLI